MQDLQSPKANMGKNTSGYVSQLKIMLRKSQSYRSKKRKVGIPGGGDINVSAFAIFHLELSF